MGECYPGSYSSPAGRSFLFSGEQKLEFVEFTDGAFSCLVDDNMCLTIKAVSCSLRDDPEHEAESVSKSRSKDVLRQFLKNV